MGRRDELAPNGARRPAGLIISDPWSGRRVAAILVVTVLVIGAVIIVVTYWSRGTDAVGEFFERGTIPSGGFAIDPGSVPGDDQIDPSESWRMGNDAGCLMTTSLRWQGDWVSGTRDGESSVFVAEIDPPGGAAGSNGTIHIYGSRDDRSIPVRIMVDGTSFSVTSIDGDITMSGDVGCDGDTIGGTYEWRTGPDGLIDSGTFEGWPSR